MSTAIFPTLQGLSWDIKPVPTMSTVVQRAKNRTSTRIMNDPFPLWTFELSFEFLPDVPPATGYSDLQTLVGFFLQRGGSFDSFYLNPGMITGRPADNQVAGQNIGTGDGVTTTFYLVRNFGGFLDEVQAVTSLAVDVAGVPVTAYTQTNGAITFATPPASGAAITATFTWYYVVAFAEDKLDGLNEFMYQLYECQKVTLEQVKL